MSRLGHFIAEKVGDIAEDVVRSALGCGDKDDDKNDRKGGILSFFGGDKDEEKEREKGGMFSFGDNKKKKDDEDDKGGFFSKIFDKDDDKEKKSGFKGLFIEHGVEGATGGNDCEFVGGSEDMGGFKGQNVAVSDGDLFDDLMDVAQETREGE